MFRVIGTLVLLLGLISCDDYFCPCTGIVVFIQFTVVDDSGFPVPNIPVQVALTRTGEVLAVDQDGAAGGVYTAFDDGHMQHLRPFFAEPVRVTGTKDGRSFSADFLIDTDECRCHVNKISGPTSVRLD